MLSMAELPVGDGLEGSEVLQRADDPETGNPHRALSGGKEDEAAQRPHGCIREKVPKYRLLRRELTWYVSQRCFRPGLV